MSQNKKMKKEDEIKKNAWKSEKIKMPEGILNENASRHADTHTRTHKCYLKRNKIFNLNTENYFYIANPYIRFLSYHCYYYYHTFLIQSIFDSRNGDVRKYGEMMVGLIPHPHFHHCAERFYFLI